MYNSEDISQAADDLISTPLQPQTILLRDGETVSTMYPIPGSPDLLPLGLLAFLLDEFNMEIENGQSFPYYESLEMDEFKKVWFDLHGVICIMVLGEIPELDYSIPVERHSEMDEALGIKYSERFTSSYAKRKDRRNLNLSIQWERQCLGIFNLKPAYPGRSSHVVTGTFLVNAGIRGKGIGKTLVDCFLNWAPQLGFTSCYFPLVYGTNVGIRRIFESSNFRRIGKLPESGILKGVDSPVDSFIYGKEFTHVSKHIDELNTSSDDTIKAKYERLIYYLEHGEYPPSCDRNEKARLRVIAKKHSLLNGRLYFKGKEVIYDTQKQLNIAHETHAVDHQGINRVTSKLAESYHWKGIKQTVIQVIASCAKCQENNGNRTHEEGIVIDARTDPSGQPRTIVHAIPHEEIGGDLSTIDTIKSAETIPNSKLKNSYVQRIKFGKSNGDDVVKRKAVTNPVESMNSFTQYAQEHNRNKKKFRPNRVGDGPGTVILEQGAPNSIVDDALLHLEDNVMAAVEAVRKEQEHVSTPIGHLARNSVSIPSHQNMSDDDADENYDEDEHDEDDQDAEGSNNDLHDSSFY